MNNGKLIIFEGVDGCGKSTHLELAYKELINKGLLESFSTIFSLDLEVASIEESVYNRGVLDSLSTPIVSA